MKKIIGIGALNENTRQFYEDVLQRILGKRCIIKSYNFSKYKAETLDVDILLISTPIMINIVKQFIDHHTKIIPISRTFTKESYEILNTIPKKTKALLVNNGIDATFETISLIYSLGFEFKLLPYYPGLQPLDDIQIAITTNEEHLVPQHIKKIYNIGHMVYDLGTLLDLLSELDFPDQVRQQILHDYQEIIIPSETGVHTLFGRNITIQNEMHTVLDLINDGVIETNVEGTIMMANTKAEEILNVAEPSLIGKNLNSIFQQEIIDKYHHKEINNQLIYYYKEMLIINLRSIFVFNKKMGYMVTFKNITELRKLEEQVRREISVKGYTARYLMDDIVGNTHKIHETKRIAKKMAKSDASILISGESGTGKELFAQAIHNTSTRKRFPFVAINCAALPENLVESELFGYEGGAFTGAKKEGKPGLFEQAHLGTLFLDEIGDLGLGMQARLLRVLQEGEVVRIGSTKIRNVDVRIIAATNKDLIELAKEKRFRWDLYYRLNVFPLAIPPLRERKEDIALIFKHFLKIFRCSRKVNHQVMDILYQHNWPGNIRELRNLAEYLVSMGSNPIQIKDLPQNFGMPKGINSEDTLDKTDKAVLELLYVQMKKRKKIGRGKLVELLEDEEVFITEKEVRNKLSHLRDIGLVEIGKGRQGSRLTEKGLKFFV